MELETDYKNCRNEYVAVSLGSNKGKQSGLLEGQYICSTHVAYLRNKARYVRFR